MKKARYNITIKDDANAEQILNEIDNYFIELEHKYPNVQVKT
jgi:hypothetical protein